MTKAEHVRLVAWRSKFLQHAAGEANTVAQTCRYFGISRKTYYKWKQRQSTYGDAGLCDQDALVPRRCPPSAAHVAERTAPAAETHVLEVNLDAVGRVEQDLGRTVTPPSPSRNWWRTVRSECRTVPVCAVREG